MNRIILFSFILFTHLPVISCAQQQSTNDIRVDVGGCEGCEAIYESPIPFEKLEPMAWLPDWTLPGKKLAVSGTVYKADGKTPAEGVIIYIYHTDQTGIYPQKGTETGWAKRHGYLRAWMKTDKDGFYKFFTLRPGSYPNRKDPAHIHVTIKEPGKQEYWIDDYVFDNDPLLTQEERRRFKNRGGSGILTTKPGGSLVKAERNIYLGRNIPGYPL